MGWPADLWWLIGEVAGLLAVAVAAGLAAGWALWGRPLRVARRRAHHLAQELDALEADLVRARLAGESRPRPATVDDVEALADRLGDVLAELAPDGPSPGDPLDRPRPD
jgi:uncharacterized protein HemX